jgi:hypothetical protein
MKAGTTSLFEYLRTHRALFLPPAKDLPFFSHDSVYSRGWGAYARVTFANAPPGRLVGKVTPQYMGVPRWDPATGAAARAEPGGITPGRIARLFPDVKLIALLRDPIERAVSHYWFSVTHRLERRPLDDALADALSASSLASAREVPTYTNSYVALGEYGRILEPYRARFSASQMRIVSSETLARDPEAVMADLWRYLGVDDSHVPQNLDRRYHAASARRRIPVNPWRIPGALRATPLRYAWRAIPEGTSEVLRSRYRTAAFRFSQWNRTRRPPPVMRPNPHLRERLIAHYADDGQRLEALVGPVAGVTITHEEPVPAI